MEPTSRLLLQVIASCAIAGGLLIIFPGWPRGLAVFVGVLTGFVLGFKIDDAVTRRGRRRDARDPEP